MDRAGGRDTRCALLVLGAVVLIGYLVLTLMMLFTSPAERGSRRHRTGPRGR